MLTLLAIPPILTNTYVGVRQVDRETRRRRPRHGADRGPDRPQGRAAAVAARRSSPACALSAVAVVATATIAPLANVQSLGNPILEPQTYGDAGQLGAAIVVALITLAADVGLGLVQRAVTPKGLTHHADRGPRAGAPSPPSPPRTETP